MATMKQHKASTKNLKKARKARKGTITARAKRKVKAAVRTVKRKVS